ncbi:RNA-binding domain-containing protein [Bimuria novae-zelandiae CBS 107.79]|uniref:RNA-binding domain-containing protein n=1 Tax=Bimuria novae-zelandiae CBS 107.79 TaxID=1447943 RepID=A0A6A5VHX6_9PLEO|nr:RNA-binding domain-containing protein [Bimuria novae-zelandiae CBS 107.79]
MSKSELKDEKKKRKRQEEEAVDAPKKPKKSKKSKDEAEDAPATEVKKETKDKRSKKDKKKDDASAPAGDATPAAATNGATDPMTQDFVAFDDEPMPDAVTGNVNGTISGEKRKKEKKDKKEKKSKKSEDADEASATVVKEEATTEEAPAEKSKSKKDKQSKKDKKDKKFKKSKSDDAAEPMEVDNAVEEPAAAESTDKKSKKDKKAKKDKKDKKAKTPVADDSSEASSIDEPAAANGTEVQDKQPNGEASAAAEGEQEADPNARFIVFIGNLPFTATKEDIEEHFAKLKPFEVRLRTYKDTGKSMGCAFIEFERFDHMQTALMKYHHSIVPDPKRKEGRKINVELSAGGGGNTAARKDKIAAKNEKLAEERQRKHDNRAENEAKREERRAKKSGKPVKEGAAAGETDEAAAEEPANEGIHPARLAMMSKPERPQKQHKPNMGNVAKWKGGPPPRPKRY